ncbi:CPBP family intramembrane metalloprotease [Bacteroides sp. OttesenSCG-928-J23]|nr:CPBP family intramembrane metalloprotease [Bacteroides sp. OttesenSCG-928-N06]MDL2247493.1 CPBP family intramembrane metalloprotease [Bacteroides sp. OttesenSCG-928-J23]MDL2304501.1 CPBP family intramembrane metalloprotease [Bacteroides sp. OttesenSCG-928-D19]
MRTAIKLVLIYFGFQILGTLFGGLIGMAYSLVVSGTPDGDKGISLSLSLLLGIVFMTVYLWKGGYVSKEKTTWSVVSFPYLLLTMVIYVASLVLIEFAMSYLQWLPDLMESTFNAMQTGWLGILGIAVLGPILEELLFRGAITRALLEEYNPTKAIVISALVFGIVHLNPVQIVSATLIGLLLGWIYYKTASLIPCVLIHVVNNSLSVWLNLTHPEAENTIDLLGSSVYYIAIGAAVVLFWLALRGMNIITNNKKTLES